MKPFSPQLSRNLSLFSLCLAGVVLISVAGCKSDYPASGRAANADPRSQPRQVKTVQVAETPIGQSVTVNGTLAVYDQATVGTKVAGRLQSISVDFGTVVRKGQAIAKLEPQDYQLRVQQAEAALAQARARVCLAPEGNDDKGAGDQR